jgi:hypothetical protein
MTKPSAPRKEAIAPGGRVVRLAIMALCCLVLAAPASEAQDNGGFGGSGGFGNSGGFGGFFQQLFNFGRPPPGPAWRNAPLRERAHKAPKKKIEVNRKQDFVPATATRAPGTPGGAPVVKPTFFVAVLGDSLGILAAQGLGDAFAAKPEVGVNNLARDVSGLTRDDYYDWPKAARDLVAAKTNFQVVVVMMGINDLQPLKENGETLDLLTDPWRAAYARRVEALLAPFQDAHIPVLWVGLPPMHDEQMNAQVIALNEIYREHVGKAGGTYVDIWDAFSDTSGQFAAFGPDADGQNAKLRSGAGGIYFTKVGARKVAQVLEPDIRRELEKANPQDARAALPADVEQEASAINAEIQRNKDAEAATPMTPIAKPSAGPIVSLSALPASPGGALIEGPKAATLKTAAQQAAASPPPGRADDFAWPPRSPEDASAH